MKRLLTVLAGTILTQIWVMAVPPLSLAADVWNAAFEASPADNDPAAAGASEIRTGRVETRARLEVEHIVGVNDGLSDDNGLHRLGSARCYMQNAAPTALADGMDDYNNTGGAGVTALTSAATNSAAGEFDDAGSARCWIDADGADGLTNDHCTGVGTDDDPADGSPDTAGVNTCCTGTDTGTCDVDDNKIYVYVGAAGTPGSCPTGYACGWQEIISGVGSSTDPGIRVKAGASTGNLVFNGDFEYDGCTGTDDPTGWTSVATETVAYANSEGAQGDGCQAVVTSVAGGDGYSQEIAGLKANTTYRVTAQVLETGADECTLTSSGAATNVTGMTSVDNTAFAQLDGFFITDATNLDTVTLTIAGTAAGDICTWDHIAVYRQEDVEVPEAGIVALYDTLTESEITAAATCSGAGAPIDCCTGAGVGATCDIAAFGAAFADVPELSLTFVPPTEGWIIHLKGSVTVGCSSSCSLADGEGVVCQLEKGGTELAGTMRAAMPQSTLNDYYITMDFDYLDINPPAGTSATYTIGCKEAKGDNGLLYNPVIATTLEEPDSMLSLIAYPPL